MFLKTVDTHVEARPKFPPPRFSYPAMFAAFIMVSGTERDNLSRRVCLPCASNYRRMRGARAGFVLKVNILYIEPQPGLERFPLSAK